MKKMKHPILETRIILPLLLNSAMLIPSLAMTDPANNAAMIAAGKEIAFDRVKGNCLACHFIEGGESPGNLGPPLVNMKKRYPDKEKLRDQIRDATIINPESSMPPFGKHQVISHQEIDQIVEFLWSK